MTSSLDLANEYEDWEPIEPLPLAFCDQYVVHEPHIYRAINGNWYDCRLGLTQDDLNAIEAEAALPPCEHGLSATMCAGPNHYPMDRDF